MNLSPNTKGIQTVKFDLFDVFGEEIKRMSLDAAYKIDDQNMHVPPDGLKLAITVGDNCASSTITLPMWFLSQAVATLMDQHMRNKSSGLVGFNKPGIVGIN